MPSAPKKVKLQVESNWIGGKVDGGICLLPDGRKVYLAFRSLRDIHRGKEKSISGAIRQRTACWGIDMSTISFLRHRDVKWVCVLLRQTGERFLAPMAPFSDSSKYRMFDRPRRNRELQSFLPFQEFTRRFGKIVNPSKYQSGPRPKRGLY
jgi:hypothetical protein